VGSALARKAFVEGLGTMLLVATVVGSGIAAQRLSPDDVGLQLLENALRTGAVLVALILAPGPVSAAFEPLVTPAERVFGAISTREAGGVHRRPVRRRRGRRGTGQPDVRPAPDRAQHPRPVRPRAVARRGGRHLRAAAGHLQRGPLRSRPARRLRRRRRHHRHVLGHGLDVLRRTRGHVARTPSDTFAGIAPASVPGFVLAQLAGAAVAGELAATEPTNPATNRSSSEGTP
jgi:arsenate reductase